MDKSKCDKHTIQIKILTNEVVRIKEDNQKHYNDILLLLKEALNNNNKLQRMSMTFYFKIIGICIAVFAILLGAKEALL